MTNERWLKWATARYYRSKGYKVSMKPVRVGNAMVDGIAVGPEGEKIAIEVKSPADDIIRGIGQCYEALAAGYNRVLLVTTFCVLHVGYDNERYLHLSVLSPVRLLLCQCFTLSNTRHGYKAGCKADLTTFHGHGNYYNLCQWLVYARVEIGKASEK